MDSSDLGWSLISYPCPPGNRRQLSWGSGRSLRLVCIVATFTIKFKENEFKLVFHGVLDYDSVIQGAPRSVDSTATIFGATEAGKQPKLGSNRN